MKLKEYKVGMRVNYKLPGGNRVCLIKRVSKSTGVHNGKPYKGHYLELLDENTGETINSAWDENIEILD